MQDDRHGGGFLIYGFYFFWVGFQYGFQYGQRHNSPYSIRQRNYDGKGSIARLGYVNWVRRSVILSFALLFNGCEKRL
jgi:hypothetical protein